MYNAFNKIGDKIKNCVYSRGSHFSGRLRHTEDSIGHYVRSSCRLNTGEAKAPPDFFFWGKDFVSRTMCNVTLSLYVTLPTYYVWIGSTCGTEVTLEQGLSLYTPN